MANNSRICLDQKTAKGLVKDGDLILLDEPGILEYLIKVIGQSTYNHSAVISIVDGKPEILEFTAKSGCVAYSWENYFKTFKRGTRASLYRANKYFTETKWNKRKKEVESKRCLFKGKRVADDFRTLLGLAYGWRTAWEIIKGNLAFGRFFFFSERIGDDTIVVPTYPVCSTAIAYCFSKNGYDLNKKRADSTILPGDLAQSARMNYLLDINYESI